MSRRRRKLCRERGPLATAEQFHAVEKKKLCKRQIVHFADDAFNRSSDEGEEQEHEKRAHMADSKSNAMTFGLNPICFCFLFPQRYDVQRFFSMNFLTDNMCSVQQQRHCTMSPHLTYPLQIQADRFNGRES